MLTCSWCKAWRLQCRPAWAWMHVGRRPCRLKHSVSAASPRSRYPWSLGDSRSAGRSLETQPRLRKQSVQSYLAKGRITVVVECIYKLYVFSHTVATSSAECNCSSPPSSLVCGQLLTISDIVWHLPHVSCTPNPPLQSPYTLQWSACPHPSKESLLVGSMDASSKRRFSQLTPHVNSLQIHPDESIWLYTTVQNLCCYLVIHFEYLLFSCRLFLVTMCKHDIIQKTWILPEEEERTTAIGCRLHKNTQVHRTRVHGKSRSRTKSHNRWRCEQSLLHSNVPYLNFYVTYYGIHRILNL